MKNLIIICSMVYTCFATSLSGVDYEKNNSYYDMTCGEQAIRYFDQLVHEGGDTCDLDTCFEVAYEFLVHCENK